MVAPFVGAWIEIPNIAPLELVCPVAPFVGAWIEITASDFKKSDKAMVAPFVGAWIEIPLYIRFILL